MSTSPLLVVGGMFLRSRKFSAAEKAFRKFIVESPDDFRGHFNLAQALTAIGDIEHALESFRKVISLDDKIPEAYSAAASILIKTKRPDAALELCIQCLNRCGNDTLCVYNMNVAYRQLGRMQDAMKLSWNILDLPHPYSYSLQKQSVMQPLQSVTSSSESSNHILPSEECKQMVDVEVEVEVEVDHHLTFILIKWGTKYGSEYVNNLYIAIARSLTRSYTTSPSPLTSNPPSTSNADNTTSTTTITTNSAASDSDSSSVFTFTPSPPLSSSAQSDFTVICLTDNSEGIDPRVDCRPLPTSHWDGWWHKAAVFSGSLGLRGTVVYIDLDTVICGSLDFFRTLLPPLPPFPPHMSLPSGVEEVEEEGGGGNEPGRGQDMSQSSAGPVLVTLCPSQFHNEGRGEGINSSVMVWRGDDTRLCFLYSFLSEHYDHIRTVLHKFDHFLEMTLLGLPPNINHCYTNTTSITDNAIVITATTQHGETEIKTSSPSSSSCPVVLYLHDILPRILGDYHAVQDIMAAEAETSAVDGDGGDIEVEAMKAVLVAAGMSIICFPLQPKPHEALHVPWVRHFWSQSSGSGSESEIHQRPSNTTLNSL